MSVKCMTIGTRVTIAFDRDVHVFPVDENLECFNDESNIGGITIEKINITLNERRELQKVLEIGFIQPYIIIAADPKRVEFATQDCKNKVILDSVDNFVTNCVSDVDNKCPIQSRFEVLVFNQNEIEKIANALL